MVVEELVGATQKILRSKAVREFDTPIELASGQKSRFFVDGKAGLAQPDDLRMACTAIDAVVRDAGIDYDAVGGLTLGADHLCVGVSLVGGRNWFIVRKEAKKRGTARQIEGTVLEPGMRVLVVEDVVSTGGSLFKAIDTIEATGATVVAATTLIDRGDSCGAILADRGIPYFPIATYADFGMEPVLAV